MGYNFTFIACSFYCSFLMFHRAVGNETGDKTFVIFNYTDEG